MLIKARCDRCSQRTLISLQLREATLPTQHGFKARVINNMLEILPMINHPILASAKLNNPLRNRKDLARHNNRHCNSSSKINKLLVRGKEPSLRDLPSNNSRQKDNSSSKDKDDCFLLVKICKASRN